MEERLGEMEGRFAELIWSKAPVQSGELVRLCAQAFAWKKSTTYTMLKRLCARGLFQNDGGTVRVLLTREEYDARRSRAMIEQDFGGSLPRFIAAFTGGRLSAEDAQELQKLIDASREE